MRKRIFRVATKSGIVHAIAHCDICEWTAETKNAFPLAAIHTKHTGHSTSGETGLAFTMKAKK